MQARYELCTEQTFNNQDDDGADPKTNETALKEE